MYVFFKYFRLSFQFLILIFYFLNKYSYQKKILIQKENKSLEIIECILY